MKRFNRHSIYDSKSVIVYQKATNRPRDLYRCGSLGMFLVFSLYERKCLEINLIAELHARSPIAK